MTKPISRRHVLKGGSVVAVATLTGCSVGADSATTETLVTPVPDPTATPRPAPTAAPTSPPIPTPTPVPPVTPTPPPPSPVATSAPGDAAIRLVSNARQDAAIDAVTDSLAGFDGTAPTIEFIDGFSYQDAIQIYLREDHDVLAWFSGYRNRKFASEGLVLDIGDVWERSPGLLPGARASATGVDGGQYLVPINYYTWAVNYSVPVFEENGWVPPTTFDEMLTLVDDMLSSGIVPFAMANDGKWPAMGTFDILNMRVNGYDFHRDLLAGRESFTDGRVKDVFTTWEALLPFHQVDPNGRTWQEAGLDLANGDAGMYLMGTFAASADDRLLSDMDFFNFPELDSTIGAGAIDAPIDGYQLSAQSPNPEQAREVLVHLASAASQQAASDADPSALYTNLDVRLPRGVTRIQRRSRELAAEADVMSSFLDRETEPELAGVCGDVFADFLADPSSIDAGLRLLEARSTDLFG